MIGGTDSPAVPSTLATSSVSPGAACATSSWATGRSGATAGRARRSARSRRPLPRQRVPLPRRHLAGNARVVAAQERGRPDGPARLLSPPTAAACSSCRSSPSTGGSSARCSWWTGPPTSSCSAPRSAQAAGNGGEQAGTRRAHGPHHSTVEPRARPDPRLALGVVRRLSGARRFSLRVIGSHATLPDRPCGRCNARARGVSRPQVAGRRARTQDRGQDRRGSGEDRGGRSRRARPRGAVASARRHRPRGREAGTLAGTRRGALRAAAAPRQLGTRALRPHRRRADGRRAARRPGGPAERHGMGLGRKVHGGARRAHAGPEAACRFRARRPAVRAHGDGAGHRTARGIAPGAGRRPARPGRRRAQRGAAGRSKHRRALARQRQLRPVLRQGGAAAFGVAPSAAARLRGGPARLRAALLVAGPRASARRSRARLAARRRGGVGPARRSRVDHGDAAARLQAAPEAAAGAAEAARRFRPRGDGTRRLAHPDRRLAGLSRTSWRGPTFRLSS